MRWQQTGRNDSGQLLCLSHHLEILINLHKAFFFFFFLQIKPVKGLNWGHAVIGNATWSGPRLRDVLKYIGVNEDDPAIQHIQV